MIHEGYGHLWIEAICGSDDPDHETLHRQATVGAAFDAVEDALPRGWRLASMASDGAENSGWYVDARRGFGADRIAASGPDLVTALGALAEKLREAK